MPEHGPADEHLLVATGRGDPEAFAELVDRLYPGPGALPTVSWAKQNVEHGVLEAFLRLQQAAPRFIPRAAFRTYFYRIITRLCLDQAWKMHPIHTDYVPDASVPDPDPSSLIMHREMSAAVNA